MFYIAVIFSIASIIISIYSILWAWIILLVGLFYHFVVLMINKLASYKYLDDLSPEENELFKKYSHYFIYRFASRDYGSSSGMIGIIAFIVGVINIFQSFYWGILLGVISFFILMTISTNFNPERKLSKEEISRARHIDEYLSKRFGKFKPKI